MIHKKGPFFGLKTTHLRRFCLLLPLFCLQDQSFGVITLARTKLLAFAQEAPNSWRCATNSLRSLYGHQTVYIVPFDDTPDQIRTEAQNAE